MSRLYLKARTDTHRSPLTATGNRLIRIELLYGSRENPAGVKVLFLRTNHNTAKLVVNGIKVDEFILP